MKIFIGGARRLTELEKPVQQRLYSIYNNGLDVLVGDCYGADTLVQRFYAGLNYNKVTVFSSGDRVRNNVGHWQVKHTDAKGLKGYAMHRQKDIVMADEADYGFMIWDGMSRGTLANIITLTALEKTTLVYLVPEKMMAVVKDFPHLEKLLSLCPRDTFALYQRIMRRTSPAGSNQTTL